MTRLMGSRPHQTTTARRREKREERREKSEERRERREETREKTEDRPQEAARGPQMRPPEVLPEGPTLFYGIPPPGGTSGGFKGRGRRAEKREKREETRENMFILVFRKVRKVCFPRIA